MEIKTEMVNDIVVLSPVGNLVASTIEPLRTQVEKLLEKNFCSVLLDMGRIDFMDSSGLGSVFAINKMVINAGGAFACTALQENVHKVFKITRADQKVSVTATRSDGLLLIQERMLQRKGR